MSTFRFLFDEHVSRPALGALRDRGVDVMHVLDTHLAGRPDAEVMARAAAEGRIVVTRNYRDLAVLVEAHRSRRAPLAGVLFLSASLPQGDAGAHVRAVETWIAAQPAGTNPVENGFGWLG